MWYRSSYRLCRTEPDWLASEYDYVQISVVLFYIFWWGSLFPSRQGQTDEKDIGMSYSEIDKILKGIDPNDNQSLDENNGITFCKSCHKQFHKIYGQGNNNRQQLENYLNVLLFHT